MRYFRRTVCLGMIAGATWSVLRANEPSLPAPRQVTVEEFLLPSAPDFDRTLEKMRKERDALESAWKSLAKRDRPLQAITEQEQMQMQIKLKRVLLFLRQERYKPAPIPSPAFDLAMDKKEPAKSNGKHAQPGKSDDADEKPITKIGAIAALDPLNLGHVLFRAEKYEEALTSFRSVDLVGKKAQERAPVQFLMACCLQHLGRYDAALELMREAANSRGDDRIASLAQWQLEMMRFERDTHERVQDFRKRRLATEKP